MQELCNNCFGSKKRGTTLCQAKTGTRAYLFSPDEGSCYVFSTRSNSCEVLLFYGVIFQSVTKALNLSKV